MDKIQRERGRGNGLEGMDTGRGGIITCITTRDVKKLAISFQKNDQPITTTRRTCVFVLQFDRQE